MYSSQILSVCPPYSLLPYPNTWSWKIKVLRMSPKDSCGIHIPVCKIFQGFSLSQEFIPWIMQDKCYRP